MCIILKVLQIIIVFNYMILIFKSMGCYLKSLIEKYECTIKQDGNYKSLLSMAYILDFKYLKKKKTWSIMVYLFCAFSIVIYHKAKYSAKNL